MSEFLQQLKTRVKVGVVGGSDLKKIKEQLGEDGNIIPSVLLFIILFAVYQKHSSKNSNSVQDSSGSRLKTVSCGSVTQLHEQSNLFVLLGNLVILDKKTKRCLI